MKKTIQFIVLTCVVSWILAGTAVLLGLRVSSGFRYTAFAAGYMMLPAICAIILQIVHKEKPFRNLGISFRLNWWFLVAGVVPIIYSFMALGINLLFPGVSFSVTFESFLSQLPAEQAELAAAQLSRFPPAVFMLLTVAQAFVAAYTVNAVFAFGEELGWRGYLLKALKDKKFLPVSLITGVVWALWHFPLICAGHNYPEHPVAGVGMMIIFCVLLTPPMTYIVIKSKSVITAAIFHGSNNAIAGLAILYLTGGNDLTNGLTGAAGFIALFLVNIAFYLYDKYITKENIFTRTIGEC
ncbi:MAG TPA: CPBP family intramembrane metalloprotease domain-containing protein [Treponema sp.]|nr:CPBP family intramembrane metalloprotease domain-containing protein [Treponema sp.]